MENISIQEYCRTNVRTTYSGFSFFVFDLVWLFIILVFLIWRALSWSSHNTWWKRLWFRTVFSLALYGEYNKTCKNLKRIWNRRISPAMTFNFYSGSWLIKKIHHMSFHLWYSSMHVGEYEWQWQGVNTPMSQYCFLMELENPNPSCSCGNNVNSVAYWSVMSWRCKEMHLFSATRYTSASSDVLFIWMEALYEITVWMHRGFLE